MAYPAKFNEEIANRVRETIAAQQTTATALIDSTGIPERTFRRRMQGNSAWTTDELVSIASVLQVPIVDLMPTVA